jgi:hypothetical protein
MKLDNISKKCKHLFLGMLILVPIIPAFADSITLDGVVSETVWVEWIEDKGYPSYRIFYTSDESYIYLGFILDGDNPNLRFAFRADTSDYLIKITDVGDLSFYPGDSSRPSWWGPKRFGLPDGIEVSIGVTEGKYSYEVKVLKEILRDNGEDLPDNFPIWVMNGARGRAIPNYYPDNREDWWFYRSGSSDRIEAVEPDETPSFHAPEFPMGTLSSIAVMAIAMLLISKKNFTKVPL